jgi:hypothetical protein
LNQGITQPITQGITMVKLDERISSLETRLQQLKVRQARIEARKRALSQRRSRKEDTRRKILVGAIVLTRVEQGLLPESELRTWLDAALSRADDRALFDLPVGGG